MSEKRLGVITETFLGHEDHGIFTFHLMLDFGESIQGFGTYCLSYSPNEGEERYNPRIGEAIGKICAAVGVSCWEELRGKTVFAERDPQTRSLISIEAPPFVPHGPEYNIRDHLGVEVEY